MEVLNAYVAFSKAFFKDHKIDVSFQHLWDLFMK